MDGTDRLSGYGNPQYDQHAKRILADKKIMAYILKRTVPEFADATLDDIANVYIEGEPEIGTVPVNPDKTNASRSGKIEGDRNESTSPTEGWVTFDILFHAKAPATNELLTLIINVEAQKTQDKNRLGYDLLKRAVYYAGRLISSQKETEFLGSDYDQVKKVYSIFICMDSPDGKSSINRYQLQEKHLLHRYEAAKASYDLINIVMIYLADGRVKDQLIGLLQLLFRNTTLSGRQREDLLENDYQVFLTRETREELNTMCNLSEGIVDRVTEQVTKSVTKAVTKEVTLKNRIDDVRALMRNTGWQVERAMEVLEVPESMRLTIMKALAN